MQYREPLPPDCPPPSAHAIAEKTVRYRLLAGSAPTQKDFDSFAKQKGRYIRRSRRTPCEQSGVSLWESLSSVRALLASDLNNDNRWQSIGELTIPPGAGKLNPVEPNGHQTWWPSKACDPIADCKVIL